MGDNGTAAAKASWRILPLLGLAYLIAFMDRANIGFAAKQMNEDLKFSATVYGLGGGLFFLSYAMLEVPSNIFLARFGARRWIARIMVTWGLLAAGMIFVRTPLQFYIVRFLLGAAEAGFFPAVVVYLAAWFPMSQRGRAVSRFYIAGPLASVVMGGVSGPLLDLDQKLGLRGWQWLLMVEGLPAVFVGVAVFFMLPDEPRRAKWLTDAEKDAIEEELMKDDALLAGPVGHDMLEPLRLPRVWILGVIGFFTIGPFMTYFLSAPTILAERTGLPRDQVGLLVSVGGVLGIVGMLFTGWYTDRRNERFLMFFVSTAGFALSLFAIALAPSRVAVVAASMLLTLVWTSVTLCTVMVTTAIVQRRLVAVSIAAMNTLSQIGAFALPYGFGALKDRTGAYTTGLYMLSGLVLLAVVLIEVLRRHVGARSGP